ncbi:MAG: hypothetical protein ACM3ML_01735 [Micromonosporaceae bacterium]
MASDLIEGRLLGREPHVPLEAARMSTTKMIFSDERARRELGPASRPARQAIADSARWFLGNGYVRPEGWPASSGPREAATAPAPHRCTVFRRRAGMSLAASGTPRGHVQGGQFAQHP